MKLIRGQNHLRLLVMISILAVVLPTTGNAGTYMFADESRPGVITHPSGYSGTGGVLDVEVCIDASAADAVLMEISVQNIVKQLNNMTASTPNLFLGGNNDIPSSTIDFESLVLHELGHCTGLGHPNLGIKTGVSGVNTDFTQSGDGVNNAYSFGAGGDSVIGSSDDDRDDDQNLHWFEMGVNNPFMDVVSPQVGSFSRDVADMPVTDDFVANAGRDAGALLGFANTEAVMQQGQYYDEDQRQLQADDVATYRMGMTGVDEIASTGDDYTINMVYGGIKADTSACDIVIESQLTGFGVCSISAYILSPTHYAISVGTFRYNSEFNWYFNPVEFCSVGDADLVVSGVNVNDNQSDEACNSITYGPGYTLGAGGVVTATAPTIILGPGTSINGTFRAINAVP